MSEGDLSARMPESTTKPDSGERPRSGTPRFRNPRLRQIADELQGNQVESAQRKLAEYLRIFPDDTDAIMLMARAADLRGRTAEAVSLLSRCLELEPGLATARFAYARLLFRLHRYRTALSEVETLLGKDERNPRYREFKADILGKIGDGDAAREICKGLVAENPGRAESWVLYAATLRALGSHEESISAYRRAIACRRSCGWAWCSLADIKGFRFGDADIHAMREELSGRGLSPDDRAQLLFALGKAYEDGEDHERAFGHYRQANTASRLTERSPPPMITPLVGRMKALYTPELLARKAGSGCKASDPIFVLGRPRSGSTLLEQILATHSAIEGAGEISYLDDLVTQLGDRECRLLGTGYPEVLEKLDGAALAGLGESYLQSAAVHRKAGRAYFVDKRPRNFLHVGMIHLILPNSKIIDIRRNPAATCVSMFKQNLGYNLSLEELGRQYRDYVELMAHFDRVMPGRIHRVIYEQLVADSEGEIRKLFDYLDLPFEETCLRHYATERAIRTPSSEQVRRPIYGDATDRWRRFEPWIGPLIETLGSVLAQYPAVPEELR